VGSRSDKVFEKTLVDACELAEELEILAVFETDLVCIGIKKQFTCEADDEI
jgi:hypothetical protein